MIPRPEVEARAFLLCRQVREHDGGPILVNVHDVRFTGELPTTFPDLTGFAIICVRAPGVRVWRLRLRCPDGHLEDFDEPMTAEADDDGVIRPIIDLSWVEFRSPGEHVFEIVEGGTVIAATQVMVHLVSASADA